jgi:hypothetical protein
MASFEEKVYVSEFNIQPTGCIGVRKTTEILKDGLVVSSTYWRCVLEPNDSQAQDVLGAEPYYLNIATYTWSQQSPQTYNPGPTTPEI